MWMFGLMNKNEAKKLMQAGYEVKKYDEGAFNKFLEPKQNFIKTVTNLHLYGVWVDGDVYGTLNKIIEEEKIKAQQKKNREMQVKKDELYEIRKIVADNAFEVADDLGEVIDSDSGWETDCDFWIKRYYVEPEKEGEDSIECHFIVTFKPNSSKIIETHVNYC